MVEEAQAFTAGGSAALTQAQRSRLSSTISSIAKRGGFVWVGIEDPEGDEVDALAQELGLHPLAVADAASGKQQPKVQEYEEHLFVVMWALDYAKVDAELAIDQIFAFVREGLVVTVVHHSGRGKGRRGNDEHGIADALTDADAEHGVLGGLYAIMNHVVAGYTEVSDHVEDELEKLEKQVFDSQTRENVRAIHRLRQQIGKAQRAISGLATALDAGREHLKTLAVGHERVEPYFRDLLDDLVGTNQLIGDQDRALDGVLSSHENNVASRQNDDMRKISAFAALLAVPTVVAGLYGMNFKNLPGVGWSFGWLVTIGAILVLDGAMYWAFKRRDWL